LKFAPNVALVSLLREHVVESLHLPVADAVGSGPPKTVTPLTLFEVQGAFGDSDAETLPDTLPDAIVPDALPLIEHALQLTE